MLVDSLPAALIGLVRAGTTGPSAPAQPEDDGLGYVVIVGALLLWGLAYLISVRIHPYRACRACKGVARRRGTVFTRSFERSGRCKGTGIRFRFGDWLFFSNRK